MQVPHSNPLVDIFISKTWFLDIAKMPSFGARQISKVMLDIALILTALLLSG